MLIPAKLLKVPYLYTFQVHLQCGVINYVVSKGRNFCSILSLNTTTIQRINIVTIARARTQSTFYHVLNNPTYRKPSNPKWRKHPIESIARRILTSRNGTRIETAFTAWQLHVLQQNLIIQKRKAHQHGSACMPMNERTCSTYVRIWSAGWCQSCYASFSSPLKSVLIDAFSSNRF